MKNKLLGIALILIAILGTIKLSMDDQLIHRKNKHLYRLNKKTKTKPLFINKVWHADFDRLVESGDIPQAWSKINQIIFIPTDPATKELIKFLRAPVRINKAGKYRLEVTVISHQSDSERTQVILQHNIIQNDNDDTIWEINRTYNLKND